MTTFISISKKALALGLLCVFANSTFSVGEEMGGGVSLAKPKR